ncbi:Pentalenene synthase [Termitomyces sp. J132]|nr:hypothetical protein C0989_011234 [Termitomyces sp. Mn162]KAH0588077.1 hypothetical protein H2248_006800 [Termitomyces sp. 'cryptogamus']KNZ78601.1 Pentalenene synthase [Termitomyces sp. J132]
MATDSFKSALFLPDPLAKWPWKCNVNPQYLQAKTESSAWIQSFTFTPRAQQVLDLGEFELLASYVYPLESKEVLRAGCDLMNLFALYDEYTDTATPHEAQQLATIVMDALRNPDKARPADECVVGEVARQFWQLSSKCASEIACRRFIEAFDMYTTSVVQQAQDRAQNYIRNIDDYILFRRSTAAVKAAFMPIQFTLNLPDEVFEDPVVQRLTDACGDLIMLMNDLYSYNVEQARSDIHNIVTTVMYHKNIDLHETMKWIDDYCSKLVHQFLNDLRHVPSFGKEFEDEVKHYLDGIAYWVRGNDSWSFESRRYFIASGLDIQKSRKVILLPRSDYQIN